jgi:hypothetical protein
VPIASKMPGQLQLIVTNLHRRYSGVTATNRMVAPQLARMISAGWLGSDAPDGIARLGVRDLLRLWRRREPLIWHARRNDEMIAGVVLKALGWPLKLLFTSAARARSRAGGAATAASDRAHRAAQSRPARRIRASRRGSSWPDAARPCGWWR